MAQKVELEALQAQVEALRAELETLKVAEEQRGCVRGSDSPKGRRRGRGLPKQEKVGRCFYCRKVGHFARDCRHNPDRDFADWWFGEDARRLTGAGPSRESRPAPGARSRECPKGLGPGAGVKPRVPSGEVHPLVLQCYHCYELWHRDRDDPEEVQSAQQSSERERSPEGTAAKTPPASPRWA